MTRPSKYGALNIIMQFTCGDRWDSSLFEGAGAGKVVEIVEVVETVEVVEIETVEVVEVETKLEMGLNVVPTGLATIMLSAVVVAAAVAVWLGTGSLSAPATMSLVFPPAEAGGVLVISMPPELMAVD